MTKIYLFVLGLSLINFFKCEPKNIKNGTPDANHSSTATTTPLPSSLKLVSYNVENLFDTIDDPTKDDEDFLPNGDLKWDGERYEKKLDKLNQVIEDAGGGSYPAILGLVEIENEKVLKDLLANAGKSSQYGIVHQESPDERGIDVALLYDKNLFSLDKEEFLQVKFPPPFSNDHTREILHAATHIQGDEVHFFVNHWPSRREGDAKSEPKRVAAAATLKKAVQEVQSKNSNAKIIIMGDFNDQPQDKSLQQTLGAKLSMKPIADKELYNLTAVLQNKGIGSYNYQGNWQMIDNLVVNDKVLNSTKGLHSDAGKLDVFEKDYMMFKHPKYGASPSRTYSGNKYIGDYSDHLPLVLEIDIIP